MKTGIYFRGSIFLRISPKFVLPSAKIHPLQNPEQIGPQELPELLARGLAAAAAAVQPAGVPSPRRLGGEEADPAPGGCGAKSKTGLPGVTQVSVFAFLPGFHFWGPMFLTHSQIFPNGMSLKAHSQILCVPDSKSSNSNLEVTSEPSLSQQVADPTPVVLGDTLNPSYANAKAMRTHGPASVSLP